MMNLRSVFKLTSPYLPWPFRKENGTKHQQRRTRGFYALRPLGAMPTKAVALLSEAECQELESFLADRIYEFNSQATGYFDGKLLAGSIRDDAGEVIAGFSGHTWGGCCYISHVWVHEQHRGKGLGKALLQVAETEARHRDCMQVVLLTHSFQAPGFYEHLGYERKYAIEGRPKGHSDIVYVKLLQGESDTCILK